MFNGNYPAWVSALLIGLTAVLSFISALFWARRTAAATLLARVAEAETEIRMLKQSVVPISTAFQAMLIKELTHDTTPELDQLMVKIGPPYVLTEDEERRLFEMLTATSKDMRPMVPETEREAAKILPLVMKRAKEETRLMEQSARLPGIVEKPVQAKQAEEKKG